jgi:hypothetical protein
MLRFVAIGALSCACNPILGLGGLSFDRASDGGSLGGSSASGGGGSGGTSGSGGGIGGGAGAKPGQTLWAHGYVNAQDGPSPHGMAIAPDDTVAVVGSFEGTVDFGVGAPLVESQELADGFVLTLNPASGDPLWVKQAYGTQYQTPVGIAAESDGSWIVVGSYRYEFRMDAEGVSTDAGGNQVIRLKLTSAGAVSPPILQYGGIGDGQQVVVGKNGSSYVKGAYGSGFDIGSGSLPAPTNGLHAGFLVQMDSAGQPGPSLGFVGTTQSSDPYPIGGLGTDSAGNAIITGAFEVPEISFGNNPPIKNPDSADPDAGAASPSIYLAKFDSALNQLWALPFGGKFNQIAQGLAIDSKDDIVIVGHVNDVFTLSPCPGMPNDGYNIMVAKLDNAGSCLWSKRFGTTGVDVRGVALTPNDEIYIVGHFSSDHLVFGSFDLVNAGAPSDAGTATSDAYVAKFDPDGNVLWARSFGDASSQYARHVVADSSGRAIVAGIFQGTIDFDGRQFTSEDSQGYTDMFVAAFAP